jgi:hypothetical protein
MSPRFQRSAVSLVLSLSLTAAIAAQPDGGISDLQTGLQGKVIGVTAEPLVVARPAVNSHAAVSALLGSPLSANAAVRIALLNNPELMVTLGAESVSLTDLFGDDAPAKLRTRQAITVLSARTYKAWVNAVAGAQSVALLREARDTSQTRNALARRMVQVGNLSKLTQAQYQAAQSDAAIALVRAEQAAFAAREQLTQLLGLWGDQANYTLPVTLPGLPESALELPNAEALALQARTDLAAARMQWEIKQRTTKLTSADDLWDTMGDAAKVRAQAVKARSQAREAYFNYRSAFDVAQHLTAEVLPLRKFINDELLLRYNGMLTSVFDVLADSQLQTQTLQAAVSAQRDFWLAHADLQAVLAGAPMDDLGTNPGSADGSRMPSGNSTAAH